MRATLVGIGRDELRDVAEHNYETGVNTVLHNVKYIKHEPNMCWDQSSQDGELYFEFEDGGSVRLWGSCEFTVEVE